MMNIPNRVALGFPMSFLDGSLISIDQDDLRERTVVNIR